MKPNRIGVFFKNPVPGEVKTRLSPPLSPEAAAILAGAFLEDAVSVCGQVAGATTVLFQAGRSDHPLPGRLSGLACFPQSEGNLGDRMGAAFDRLLSGGGKKAIIVGSDCPTLAPTFLRSAFEALGSSDVVLGPTVDGGYYLVGLTVQRPEIFKSISWSTSTVLAETLKILKDIDLRVTCVDTCYDVDDGEALRFLVRELSREPAAGESPVAPATRRALAHLCLLDG